MAMLIPEQHALAAQFHEEFEEDNPFAPLDQPADQPNSKKSRRRERNRHWELGFKIDVPEFHNGLQPEEFLDWMTIVKKILEFKEVPSDKHVSLIITRFRIRAAI
ncbi:hypothetical protein TorRG33x02_144560 [Trema orientale]|uniref:Uncharacterized protein n=1 Tax=Trema orientale TaxID=63057 RepID=A0A2P5EW58_TREOI|nr:hypothetical protein TorRG33x02_144560 [Trema orientale]